MEPKYLHRLEGFERNLQINGHSTMHQCISLAAKMQLLMRTKLPALDNLDTLKCKSGLGQGRFRISVTSLGYFKHYNVVNIPGSTLARAWLTRGGSGSQEVAEAAVLRQEMSGAVKECRGSEGLLQERGVRGREEQDW